MHHTFFKEHGLSHFTTDGNLIVQEFQVWTFPVPKLYIYVLAFFSFWLM